jgi:PAS domain S-box-containing protein
VSWPESGGRSALQSLDARAAAILEVALDCVIMIDAAGRITFFNAAAEQTFGLESADVLGREMAEVIVPPSLRARHRAGLAHYLATGRPKLLDQRIQITAMRCDGEEFPAELTVTRADLEGEPVFTGYLRDITERTLAEAELVSARERFEVLADEQAALRRVATLVASGAPSDEVFDSVCVETGRLIGATSVRLACFTSDGMNLTMAAWSDRAAQVPAGTRLPLAGDSANAIVRRTGAPARVDSYEGVEGPLPALLRELGIRSEVAAPVAVDGYVWGALVAGMHRAEPLPDGTESRVASFAELIGTAVSNATARAELIATSRRVIEAGFSARRRVTRDIHDGAQQRFVNSLIHLQLARRRLPDVSAAVAELLDLAAGEARSGVDALRELAAGIHPSVLTDRGLEAALEALVSGFALPVALDVSIDRVPPAVEASVYFLCAEALTNVLKHARAETADVAVDMEGDQLVAVVADDGMGGATMDGDGTGLVGLHDRVTALEGNLEILSPPGEGTILRASIPVAGGVQVPA